MCALLLDGTVKCWGTMPSASWVTATSGSGQSFGASLGGNLPGHPATQIAAGGEDTCVVMQDHTVSCWGAAEDGQLGNGVRFPYDSSPVRVSNINNATEVSVGQGYACDVRADGRVSCWGSDLNGQLGNTTHVATADIDVPTRRCAQRRRRETGQRRRRDDVRNPRGRHRQVLGRRVARRRDLELTPQSGERDRTARKLTTASTHAPPSLHQPTARSACGASARVVELIEMLGGARGDDHDARTRHAGPTTIAVSTPRSGSLVSRITTQLTPSLSHRAGARTKPISTGPASQTSATKTKRAAGSNKKNPAKHRRSASYRGLPPCFDPRSRIRRPAGQWWYCGRRQVLGLRLSEVVPRSAAWLRLRIAVARSPFGNVPNINWLEIGEVPARRVRAIFIQFASDRGLGGGFQMTGKGLKIVVLSVLASAIAMLAPGLTRAASIHGFTGGVTNPGPMVTGWDGNI